MMHDQHSARKAIKAMMELCIGRLTCDLTHNKGSDSSRLTSNLIKLEH